MWQIALYGGQVVVINDQYAGQLRPAFTRKGADTNLSHVRV